MKQVFLSLAVLLFTASTFGQIVFESNFNSWTGSTPDAWVGSKTNLLPDSLQQSTNAPTYGSYLAGVVNFQGSHRRFTTQGILLEENVPYEVEVWVKGNGNIRTGLYDGDLDGGDFGYSYNDYYEVGSDIVSSFVQTITPDTSSSECELILSVVNGAVELDRVEIRLGDVQEPIPTTIEQIQFTTDAAGESPQLDMFVETAGVVTAVADNGFYMQDGSGEWSGLRVIDSDFEVARGDSVVVVGTVEEFFACTRINDVITVTVVSNGPVPDATILDTNSPNAEGYEGVLVTTTGTCILEPDGNGEWYIDDVSGPIQIDDEMYAFAATMNVVYTVTGPVNYAFSAFKIEPRDADDVLFSSGILENSSIAINTYPNPVDDLLTVKHQEKGTVVLNLWDSNGKLVMDSILTSETETVDMSSLSAGQYTLILRTSSGYAGRRIQVTK